MADYQIWTWTATILFHLSPFKPSANFRWQNYQFFSTLVTFKFRSFSYNAQSLKQCQPTKLQLHKTRQDFKLLRYVFTLATFLFSDAIFLTHGNDLFLGQALTLRSTVERAVCLILKSYWSCSILTEMHNFCLPLVFVSSPSTQLNTWVAGQLLWRFCMFCPSWSYFLWRLTVKRESVLKSYWSWPTHNKAFVIGLYSSDFNANRTMLHMINSFDKTWCTFLFKLSVALDAYGLDGTQQSKKQ